MTVAVINRKDAERIRRVHVTNPLWWGDSAGTDFWYMAGSATNGATTFLLSSTGWTTTSLGLTQGSGADFIASGDKGTPRQALMNAQNDTLVSPFIFGDYAHSRQAQILMGKSTLPRYLIMDALATFSVVANTEDQTGIGFVEAGGTSTTAADHFAVISSATTTWIIKSGADSGTTTIVADTSPHWFRIIIDRGSATSGGITDGIRWFVDGVNAGTTIDVEADLSPMAFTAVSGGANNLVQPSIAHIYYEWDLFGLDPLTT